jgi:hypothetical protein
MGFLLNTEVSVDSWSLIPFSDIDHLSYNALRLLRTEGDELKWPHRPHVAWPTTRSRIDLSKRENAQILRTERADYSPQTLVHYAVAIQITLQRAQIVHEWSQKLDKNYT